MTERKRYSILVKTEPQCVKIFVDDMEESGFESIVPSQVVGIELYQLSSAPLRYASSDCAAVIVWTVRYRGAHH